MTLGLPELDGGFDITLQPEMLCAADERAVDDGCTYEPDRGLHVVNFIQSFCCHSKGQFAGEPFLLLPWQFRFIMRLYSWVRADGTRRFRRAYAELPKKAGKSLTASALSLYHLCMDGEEGAEVYNAAGDRAQASIVWNEAANMVQQSPDLSRRLNPIRSTKRITYEATHSVYQALSADAPTKEGLNASFTLFDELHAQQFRDLWDRLYYAGRMRRQPLLMVITTAGTDRESLCWEQHEQARAVIESESTDPSLCAVIYAADDEDDWTDPKIWAKANPSFGTLITEESMREECDEAKRSPASEARFKRYCLNIWTRPDTKAIRDSDWRACRTDLVPELLQGQRCIVGLDLASVRDLAAMVFLFPDEESKTYTIWPHLYTPRLGIEERARRDHVPYGQWVHDGHLLTTPGKTLDYAFIRQQLLDRREQGYKVQKVGYDPWNAEETAHNLSGESFDMVAVRQGYFSISEPSKAFERLVIEHQIRHGGNPVMDWMMGNLMWKSQPDGNRKPTKENEASKIDGPVAAITALAVAVVTDPEKVLDPLRGLNFL